jgi:hypothetical protein
MREWEASPLEPHKAMSLAVNLNQMADYFWHEHGSDPTKVLGATDLGAFRNALSASLPEFALVRDVAEAHKHFRLSRSIERSLVRSKQPWERCVGTVHFGMTQDGIAPMRLSLHAMMDQSTRSRPLYGRCTTDG